MLKPTWQLQIPVNAIIFDCDGTLSSLEGINELAKHNGVLESVQVLTETAMAKTGINPELYQKRLDLVYPNRAQVEALGQQYFTHVVPDACPVIEILHKLNKTVYIVSAGLYPAVKIFGDLLQIPTNHIFAVDITFDSAGNYEHYEVTSPLINNDGKRTIVQQLKAKHAEIIHIGDGLNDYITHDLVTRFVGYGGVYYRKNIAERCDYYIATRSLAPFLPLSLTQDEYEKLSGDEIQLYQSGLSAIHAGRVQIG